MKMMRNRPDVWSWYLRSISFLSSLQSSFKSAPSCSVYFETVSPRVAMMPTNTNRVVSGQFDLKSDDDDIVVTLRMT